MEAPLNRFVLPLDSKRLRRYAVGVALAAAALLMRLALDPILGRVAPWSPFFLAVVLASVVGGFGSGITAAISSVGLGGYFVLRLQDESSTAGASESASIVVFLAVSAAVAWVGHTLRLALHRRGVALAEGVAERELLKAETRMRKEVEAALRERTAELERALSMLDALIDNSPIGISIFDKELRFVRTNAVVARTTGLPLEKHVGHRISELLPRTPGQTEGKLCTGS